MAATNNNNISSISSINGIITTIQTQAEYIKVLEEKIKALELRPPAPTFEDELREIATLMCSYSRNSYNITSDAKIKLMHFLKKYSQMQFIIFTNSYNKIVRFDSLESIMRDDRESTFFWKKYQHTSLLHDNISKHIILKDTNGESRSIEPFYSIYNSLNHPDNLYLYIEPNDQCSNHNCENNYRHDECSGFTRAEFKKFARMMEDYKEMTVEK